MLQFSILASGSSGNAVYIQSETTRLLLDAGISARQIRDRMRAAGADVFHDLDALLLTHEHVDHIRGFPQVVKQTEARVYATEGTWHHVARAVADHMPAERHHTVRAGEPFTIGDIRVTPFAVSHDAEEPVAYRFDAGGSALTVLTDLGYVSDAIKSVVQGCQTYVWEANHDVEMLRTGRYPWHLKRRILGDKGHLSNEDAAVALADIVGDSAIDVYLAHLSEENNLPDLAELTVHTILKECRPLYGELVRLHRTSRTQPTPLTAL
ncbi:MBL fold metallo-hydrolase [Alicyclobacillus macrosporangiidus]|uniref:Phosphoribosyl 1,2-cyclic phosphodiesterase n=1 Tax=Alicyclobacillus macrosporangiidus TaxID=392015 RepID=A0A1I7HQP5_9BACL|nr:MBL fold metallo-hydrolase [Alicyclobacillus macrosporangiidus]SFU62981.1 Phosphoribosyl 1,2-cyclic phosphodiesterase [Alicyclobacillus macrosporangiidus]